MIQQTKSTSVWFENILSGQADAVRPFRHSVKKMNGVKNFLFDWAVGIHDDSDTKFAAHMISNWHSTWRNMNGYIHVLYQDLSPTRQTGRNQLFNYNMLQCGELHVGERLIADLFNPSLITASTLGQSDRYPSFKYPKLKNRIIDIIDKYIPIFENDIENEEFDHVIPVSLKKCFPLTTDVAFYNDFIKLNPNDKDVLDVMKKYRLSKLPKKRTKRKKRLMAKNKVKIETKEKITDRINRQMANYTFIKKTSNNTTCGKCLKGEIIQEGSEDTNFTFFWICCSQCQIWYHAGNSSSACEQIEQSEEYWKGNRDYFCVHGGCDKTRKAIESDISYEITDDNEYFTSQYKVTLYANERENDCLFNINNIDKKFDFLNVNAKYDEQKQFDQSECKNAVDITTKSTLKSNQYKNTNNSNENNNDDQSEESNNSSNDCNDNNNDNNDDKNDGRAVVQARYSQRLQNKDNRMVLKRKYQAAIGNDELAHTPKRKKRRKNGSTSKKPKKTDGDKKWHKRRVTTERTTKSNFIKTVKQRFVDFMKLVRSLVVSNIIFPETLALQGEIFDFEEHVDVIENVLDGNIHFNNNHNSNSNNNNTHNNPNQFNNSKSSNQNNNSNSNNSNSNNSNSNNSNSNNNNSNDKNTNNNSTNSGSTDDDVNSICSKTEYVDDWRKSEYEKFVGIWNDSYRQYNWDVNINDALKQFSYFKSRMWYLVQKGILKQKYEINEKAWKKNYGTKYFLHNEVGRLLLTDKKFHNNVSDFTFHWSRCEMQHPAQARTEGGVFKGKKRFKSHLRFSLCDTLFGQEHTINDVIQVYPYKISYFAEICGKTWIDKYGIKSILYVGNKKHDKVNDVVKNQIEKQKYDNSIDWSSMEEEDFDSSQSNNLASDSDGGSCGDASYSGESDDDTSDSVIDSTSSKDSASHHGINAAHFVGISKDANEIESANKGRVELSSNINSRNQNNYNSDRKEDEKNDKKKNKKKNKDQSSRSNIKSGKREIDDDSSEDDGSSEDD